MERNSRCSSFVRMRNPTPLFSLGLWRNKTIMATPGQRAFCVLQIVKHESVVSVQRAFRRQFNRDPPSPDSIRRWYQQFQTRGAFVKEKVQDGRVCQKKAWNEWDSLFFAVRRKETFVGMYHKLVELLFHFQLPNRSNHFDTPYIYIYISNMYPMKEGDHLWDQCMDVR